MSNKVTIDKKKFEMCKNDEKFYLIIALMKILNVLKYCHYCIIESEKYKEPVDLMMRFNGLFYSVGVIFEAYNLRKRLYENFTGTPEFDDGLKKLFETKEYNKLINDIISNFRNKSIFHYDIGFIKDTLNLYNKPEYNVLISSGTEALNNYYIMADEVFLGSLINFGKAEKEQEEDLKNLLVKVLQIMLKYIEGAEQLIGFYLVSIADAQFQK